MSENRPNPVQQIFGEDLAAGRRLSAEVRMARPADQPRGPSARLSRMDWTFEPAGGVLLQNLAALFTGGYCQACRIPLGERTRWRMKVRYTDALSRQCDGVLSQLKERPAGPTYRLYTKRFLSLLPARARPRFRYRAVTVANPTKTNPDLFEVVGSDTHAEVVALRGGNPDQARCEVCGRWDLPHYPLVGALPDWLNPNGEDIRRDQPTTYVATDSLPNPTPNWYTFGNWRRGVSLGVSQQRLALGDQHHSKGVSMWPLGLVTRDLIDANSPRAV